MLTGNRCEGHNLLRSTLLLFIINVYLIDACCIISYWCRLESVVVGNWLVGDRNRSVVVAKGCLLAENVPKRNSSKNLLLLGSPVVKIGCRSLPGIDGVGYHWKIPSGSISTTLNETLYRSIVVLYRIVVWYCIVSLLTKFLKLVVLG